MTYQNNPFVQPSQLEKSLLIELAAAAYSCYERSWAWAGGGNFSLHIRPNLVWASRSGGDKGLLSPAGFVPVSKRSGEKWQISLPDPSEELAVHIAIYERFADARCVVHAHPPGVVKASRSVGSLSFISEEMQKALVFKSIETGLEIKIAPNDQGDSLKDFCRSGLREFFHIDAQLVVFERHGVYAWGSQPSEAVRRIEALEYLCQST